MRPVGYGGIVGDLFRGPAQGALPGGPAGGIGPAWGIGPGRGTSGWPAVWQRAGWAALHRGRVPYPTLHRSRAFHTWHSEPLTGIDAATGTLELATHADASLQGPAGYHERGEAGGAHRGTDVLHAGVDQTLPNPENLPHSDGRPMLQSVAEQQEIKMVMRPGEAAGPGRGPEAEAGSQAASMLRSYKSFHSWDNPWEQHAP